MNELASSIRVPRVHALEGLNVTVGPIRVVMREAMFPTLSRFADETVILTATVEEGKGPLAAIRSENGGNTWRPVPKKTSAAGSAETQMTDSAALGTGCSAIELRDGMAMTVSVYTQPIPERPGWYRTTRWESDDRWRTVRGPLTDGLLYLPPDEFDPQRVQWFHGNIIELPDGRLIAIMQGIERSEQPFYPFRVYAAESVDRGKTWTFVSIVGSLGTAENPEALAGPGWRLHGPCEPCILHLGGGQLVCVMRIVNDDLAPLTGPMTDDYHDLSCTVPATGIHPDSVAVPEGKYVHPGPLAPPLLMARSSDYGRTWSQARAMSPARGCFPRLAQSDGILALSYGGLAFPRWGNCLTFSLDQGQTWSREINFAPFLTTGYTDVIRIGPGRFLCVFDCTPPQPWTNHAAHWVGAVNIDLKKRG